MLKEHSRSLIIFLCSVSKLGFRNKFSYSNSLINHLSNLFSNHSWGLKPNCCWGFLVNVLGVRIAKGFSRLFKEVSVSFGIRARFGSRSGFIFTISFISFLISCVCCVL